MNREYLNETFRRIGFTPNEAQWAPLLYDNRIIFVTGGERGGKSTTAAHYYIPRWPLYDLVWICGKDYETCRPEFKYIAEALLALNDQGVHVLENKHEGEKSISFPERDQLSIRLVGGKRVITKSLRDILKIGSEAPDLIILCEAAQVEFEAFLRLRSRLLEKRGTLYATGTLEGSLNYYADLIRFYSSGREDGKAFSIPSWENTAIFPDGENDPEFARLKQFMPADKFMERFAAVPCKPSNIVVKEFSNVVHVGDFPYDPALPVEIGVDPGYGGAFAITAFQLQSAGLVAVDEVYHCGYTTHEMIDIMRDPVDHPWGMHVTSGAIDIAATQHHSDRSVLEIFQKKGIFLARKKIFEEDGINLLREWMLVNPLTGQPRFHINHSCKGLIAECGGGMDPELKDRIEDIGPWMRDKVTKKPLLKNNHACKEVIYYIANRFGYTPRRLKRKVMHTMG